VVGAQVVVGLRQVPLVLQRVSPRKLAAVLLQLRELQLVELLVQQPQLLAI
jgi:hypothetical protein